MLYGTGYITAQEIMKRKFESEYLFRNVDLMLNESEMRKKGDGPISVIDQQKSDKVLPNKK